MKIFNFFIQIFNHVYNYLIMKKYKTIYGKNLDIRGRIMLRKNVTFLDNVIINSGRKQNVIGGQTQSQFITKGNGKILIGNNVGISNTTIVSSEKVTIEDNVMIGGSCKIYDTDFHSIRYEWRMEKPDTHIKSKPICIKEGAFIGAHSIILKGVTIGKNSIIGAGSVVTKNVPDNEIWGGNPAKFLKKCKTEE